MRALSSACSVVSSFQTSSDSASTSSLVSVPPSTRRSAKMSRTRGCFLIFAVISGWV